MLLPGWISGMNGPDSFSAFMQVFELRPPLRIRAAYRPFIDWRLERQWGREDDGPHVSEVARMGAPNSFPPGTVRLERRALTLWPRIDPAALRRCRDDPDRMTALIERRTSLSADSIRALLLMPEVTDEDARTWFG